MIGLLPAAGKAERIHGLPKYLLPVGESYLLKAHVDAMLKAGCMSVAIGANDDNYDLIQSYTGAYVYKAAAYQTMTETLLSGWLTLPSDMRKESVLFGMPDTYWTNFGYDALLRFINLPDVVLFCHQVRWNQWRRGGMVTVEVGGRVSRIVDKPLLMPETPWIWSAMLWQPTLWPYIRPEDKHVGYSVQRAVEAGLHVHAVVAWEGDYYDCGTPEEYFEMIRALTKEKAST